jgi:hypothetical protein
MHISWVPPSLAAAHTPPHLRAAKAEAENEIRGEIRPQGCEDKKIESSSKKPPN